MIPRLVFVLAILCAASWTVTLMLWALHVRLTQRYVLLRDDLMHALTENLMLRTELMKRATNADLGKWIERPFHQEPLTPAQQELYRLYADKKKGNA